MEIIIIIPTLAAGGAERVVSELATQWSIEGIQVSFALLGGGSPFYEVPTSVNIYDLSFPRYKRVSKIISLPLTFIALRKLVKQINPDLVLSFLERFNIFSLFATKGLDIPITVADRNDPTRNLSPILYLAKKRSYSWTRAVVVQTEFAKGILSEMLPPGHVVSVIPNCIKKIEMDPSQQRRKIILNVGRFYPQKGHKNLLEAFARLSDSSWILRILGDGSMRKELEEKAHDLGILNRVQFMGTVVDVDKHLAEASIFVFPSLFEGFPNALCEAMAAGLACVSTDCNTGPSEVIEDGVNGYLVPVGDIDAMVEKIKLLQDDPVHRAVLGTEAEKLAVRLERGSISRIWLDVMSGVKKD